MRISHSRNQHSENCRTTIFLQLRASIKSYGPAQGQNDLTSIISEAGATNSLLWINFLEGLCVSSVKVQYQNRVQLPTNFYNNTSYNPVNGSSTILVEVTSFCKQSYLLEYPEQVTEPPTTDLQDSAAP